MVYNSLVSIRESKLVWELNKPEYIEMWILELSKVLIYEFHYNYIKNKYDKKSILLFTDTDSLMYEIKTDVYEDFSSNKEMFDFSNYLTKSKCYDNSNKLVIGKTKDETVGFAIEEFVALKCKMYLFLADNNEHKKAKGLNKNIGSTINHSEYKMLCWIKNVWDTQWTEFKVKTIG